MFASLLLLLPLLVSFSHALDEGTVATLKIFNGVLKVQNHPISPNSSTSQQNHELKDSLSDFSLSCESCDGGRQVLQFDEGPLLLHAVLSDNSLSLLESDVSGNVGAELKPVQVVGLDSNCIPLYLLPFRYSKKHFAVVCADFGVQLGTITPAAHRIALQSYLPGPTTSSSSVLVESESQLRVINVLITEGRYRIYSYHATNPEFPDLPDNIKCTNDDIELFSLNGQEKFLLQCQTEYGPTLYIVSLDEDETARALDASGHPYSSSDGSYLSMVDGTSIVSFVTANESVVFPPEMFESRITNLTFFSSNSAQVITEDKKHHVLDLMNNGESKRRLMPGGLPTKWIWVSPYNIYLYLTQDEELYAFEGTAEKPEVNFPKLLSSQPQILLFIPKYFPPPPTPPTETMTAPPEPRLDENNDLVVGVSVSVTIFLVLVLVAFVSVVLFGIYINRDKDNKKPIQVVEGRDSEMTTRKNDSSSSDISSAVEATAFIPAVPTDNPSTNGVYNPMVVTETVTVSMATRLETAPPAEDPNNKDRQHGTESEDRHLLIPATDSTLTPPGAPVDTKTVEQPTVTAQKISASPPSPKTPSSPVERPRYTKNDDIYPFSGTASHPCYTGTASSAYGKFEEPNSAGPRHIDMT